MIRLLALTFALPAFAQSPWTQLEAANGVLVETRPVPGSAFEEIRVTTDSVARPERVCEAVWGGDTRHLEAGFKSRQTLMETPQERLTYERVTAPLARDRDYTLHVQRQSTPQGGCQVRFETQNEKGPPPQPGAVRVPAIRGTWEVTPQPQGARVVYTVYSEPGGRVPGFLARGGQRSSAKDWMKIILGRLDAPAEAHALR